MRLTEPEGVAYTHRRFWVWPSYDPEGHRWSVDVRVLWRRPTPCATPLATIDGGALEVAAPPYRADATVSCLTRHAAAPLTPVESLVFLLPGLPLAFTGPEDGLSSEKGAWRSGKKVCGKRSDGSPVEDERLVELRRMLSHP